MNFRFAQTALAATVAFAAATAGAQATLPLKESFVYSTSALNGNTVQGGTWGVTGANATSSPAVLQQSLAYAGLPNITGGSIFLANASNFEDPGLDITGVNSGSVYGSFILNVNNAGSAAAGDYFFHFSSAGTAATDFHSRVFVIPGTVANTYRFQLRNHNNDAITTDTTDRPINVPVFVVASYDFVSGAINDVSRLWVNPALGLASAPAATVTCTASGTNVDLTTVGRVNFRQGSASTSQLFQLDELRVGTAWTDVAPSAPAAVAEWSLYN